MQNNKAAHTSFKHLLFYNSYRNIHFKINQYLSIHDFQYIQINRSLLLITNETKQTFKCRKSNLKKIY